MRLCQANMFTKFYTALFVLLSPGVFSAKAQKDLQEKVKPVVAEGRLLYGLESASWFGTDLFLEKYKKRENVGGYFSYAKDSGWACVFLSKSEPVKIIGTITFDSSISPKKAKVILNERDLSEEELNLYELRKIALKQISTDTFFHQYKGANLNIIPIVSQGERRVYVLTASQKASVIYFGNDYLLTYSRSNKLKEKRRLHQNLMPLDHSDMKTIKAGVHNHSAKTGEFMTATDICTILLYEKVVHWQQYYVMSEKYVNIWDFNADNLVVITREAYEKINADRKD